MAEGMHPQAACEKAVNQLDHRLKERRGHAGDLSLIAMNIFFDLCKKPEKFSHVA